MRIVISLGNAALDAGPTTGPVAASDRFRGVHVAALGVHALLDMGHEVLVTHPHAHRGKEGGIMPGELDRTPLADQEARADGLLGYLLEQALRNIDGAKRSFVTVVTHVLVDDRDPAFASPTALIGPSVGEAEARRLERTLHWTMRPDGEYWRRAVAEPEPVTVLQHAAIDRLLDGGHTVLCAGAGIPVVRDVQRHERGAEARVDKDLGSALLAREVGADALLIVTDVAGVYADWASPERHRLTEISAGTLALEDYEAHSVRPKLDAAVRAARRGSRVVIGAVGDLVPMLEGRAGTRVVA